MESVVFAMIEGAGGWSGKACPNFLLFGNGT